GGGPQGHALRRLLPRRGLLGHGLPDRRLDGAAERLHGGQAVPAGAGDERGGHRAVGGRGRRHRRSQRPPRADRGHGAGRRRGGGARPGADVRDAHVRVEPALDDRRPRRLLDGVLALRGSAEPARREGRRGPPGREGQALARRSMFVSHVECTVCGQHHAARGVLTVCVRCGQMLAVRYDLPRVAAAVTKDALRQRPPGMYRFRELLPLDDGEEPVTLGEGGTPLLALPRLAAHLGLRHLLAKDEGQNPTGCFKARGLGMAITRARTFGVRGLMIPSAGNAGGAAAVYGARAGIPVAVVVPRDTPEAAIAEAALAGAHVFTVDGTIATAGRVIAAVAPEIGWFDLATLKEPYRLEGKKTIGLELAEQLGWDAPDVLVYPTGGGTGLVGIWKAYEELAGMGWVKAGQPRFV